MLDCIQNTLLRRAFIKAEQIEKLSRAQKSKPRVATGLISLRNFFKIIPSMTVHGNEDEN